jgi:hypothetical protein
MNLFRQQLFAIAASLVLALPPGACGVLQSRQLAKFAPAKASCCQTVDPAGPCGSSHGSSNGPTHSSVQCCCAHDATLPKKSTQPTNPVDLALIHCADRFSPSVGAQSGNEPELGSLRPGPRLQVLLCVWRC